MFSGRGEEKLEEKTTKDRKEERIQKEKWKGREEQDGQMGKAKQTECNVIKCKLWKQFSKNIKSNVITEK